MNKIIQYKHHGRIVSVRDDLKGTHRQNCLCHQCKRFKPESRENNCRIANLLYSVDVMCGITTPVFECPKFKEKN